MSSPSDPLELLRSAWTLALNEGALRLLREAVRTGGLERKRALQVSGRTDVTRTAAEDLADRLAIVGLLERRPGKPVSFTPTGLGEAVVSFIDQHAGVSPRSVQRPGVVLLDEDNRRLLEESGFELYDVLTRAAIDVASIRRRKR
jgi:hypothetical protein